MTEDHIGRVPHFQGQGIGRALTNACIDLAENWLGLTRFDPWLSYVLMIGLALAALHLVEKPAQRQLRKWMGVLFAG